MKKRLFSVHSKIIKNYTTVLAGTGAGRFISFLISVILARSLSTAEFGLFSLFFTVMILTWQFPNVIDLAYVRYAKAGEQGDRADYLRISFLMKAGIFILLIVLSYPSGYLLAYHVFNKPDTVFFITTAIITGAFLSLFSTLAGLYQAEENFVKYSLVNTLFYSGMILIIGIFIFFRFNLTPAAAAWISIFTASIAACFGVFCIYRKIKYLFPVHISFLFDMFHFGKWLLAANLTYIIIQRLDILVLAKYMDYDTLGIYSAGVRVAMAAALFTGSVSAVLMPRGSKALKSLQSLKSYLKESLLITSALIFIIAVLIIISPFLIKVLFGARYIAALLPARVLLLASVFIVLYTPLSYLFYAENKSRKIFELGAVILIAAVCSLLFLVPKFGTAGAAASIAFSYFCGLVFVLFKSFGTIKRAYGYL